MPKQRKSMSFRNLEIEMKDHISLLSISIPKGDPQAMVQGVGEVFDLLEKLKFDEQTYVVILIAKVEGAFSVNEKTLAETTRAMNQIDRVLPPLAECISRVESPVIAGVEGDAVGPGLEWVLACDLRIASETSRFGLPHVKFGHIPCEGGTQRLSRLVGRGKASEMILTGERINAQEALRIGLVNQVVPRGKVSKAVMALAKDIASQSPNSTRYTKEAICNGMDLNLDQGLRLEADLYFLMHSTQDRREGIQAFQKKRKAHFEGN